MALKIVIERNIPFVQGVLENVADVRYLAPEDIDSGSMRDADALITRTRTRCDASLLEGSRCRFIASATIGLDHIDLDYCRRKGITVKNAPGCNAPAVAQYVYASLLAIYGDTLPGKTIGVVGVGHVGSIVADWAPQLGLIPLLCDPPRAGHEGDAGFTSLEDIAAHADIITFHTPLTTAGEHKTLHLLDDRLVETFVRKPVVINAARGGVTETGALLRGLESGKIGHAVIDCWEGEPDISLNLLDKAAIATPHIAGYSREGKIRATRVAVEALCDEFGLPRPIWNEHVAPGAAASVNAQAIAASYDPLADTERLRNSPEAFETLRNRYNLRSEVN